MNLAFIAVASIMTLASSMPGMTSLSAVLATHSSTVIVDGDYRKFYVVEESPPNTFVCNLVNDLGLDTKYDSSVIERLRFSFLTHPPFDRPYFSVDERSGIIRTTRKIDREKVCPSASPRGSGAPAPSRVTGPHGVYHQPAAAGSGATACLAQFDVAIKPIEYIQIVKVAVEIVDINDHAPEFPTGHIQHRIAESADPESGGIVIPSAADPDAGRNAVRKYELVSATDKFLLDTRETADGGTDLRLLLREPLDRESEDRYEVIIVAFDGGNPTKSGSTVVNITVIDVNDNPPVFDNDTYAVRVAENTPGGTTVARVRARDADLDANAAVTYSFTSLTEQRHGRLFGIRPDSGKIYVKNDPGATLDRETAGVHLLSVTATDHGANPLSAHATVVVHVDDVNDNAPLINVNTLTIDGQAEVAENAPPGTFVAYASVHDADSAENGIFRCGVMTSSFGGESVRFALRQQPFAASEYQLVTTATFDREQRDRYDVTITCSDSGHPSLTSSQLVRVRVRDDNDNAPQFKQEVYEFEIEENCPVGTAVGHVQAVDSDAGANGEVEYRFHGISPSASSHTSGVGKLLRINARTGHISTRDLIDREAIMVTSDEPIEFAVIAVDNGGSASGQTATATVRLYINDVDDQPPRFLHDHYDFYVTENQLPGVFVGQVEAIDSDLPPNNLVTYSIKASSKDALVLPLSHFAFEIDPETGNISAREPLDRERKADYMFDVIAHGQRNEADESSFSGSLTTLTASTLVTVHVLDLNDHQPSFTNPLGQNQTMGVSSLAPVGYIISRLRAVDLDSGSNANLTYSIVSGNRRDTFHLHPITGVLSLAADISDIVFEDFLLKISVQDGGHPVPLVNYAELRVIISRDIMLPTPAPTSALDLTRLYGGVLASENTAVVLAATLATILTAVAAIAVTICVIRWRAHARRVYRCNGPSTLDNGTTKNFTGNIGLNDLKPNQAAVWGTPGFSGSTDMIRSNGRVHPVDFVGTVGPPSTPCLRLHQSPLRGTSISSNGQLITSSSDFYDSLALIPPVSGTDSEGHFGSRQGTYDIDTGISLPGCGVTGWDGLHDSMTISGHATGSFEHGHLLPPPLSVVVPAVSAADSDIEGTIATTSSLRYQVTHETENGDAPVNKPVVVFVKDQLQRDFERFSPGSNSNTDSGRGNSDYGEEPSPPMTTSTHESPSRFDSDSIRRLTGSPVRRSSISTDTATKFYTSSSPRSASRALLHPSTTAGLSAGLSGSSLSRRTGTGNHFDHYHTLAGCNLIRRNTSFSVGPEMTLSFVNGSGGTPSHFIAGYVGGSPKRYNTSTGSATNGLTGAVKGQRSRSMVRGGMKMTETVSDINLARHMTSALAGDMELTQYAVTTDRSAGKRHLLVAKYNNGTITTAATSTVTPVRQTNDVIATETLASSGSLNRSIQALPDTVI